MTTKQRAQLLRAGELIAIGLHTCICTTMPSMGLDHIEEGFLIDPGTAYWWGYGSTHAHEEHRQARLIGIAMMLTMPKEILEGKCYDKKTKGKRIR